MSTVEKLPAFLKIVKTAKLVKIIQISRIDKFTSITTTAEITTVAKIANIAQWANRYMRVFGLAVVELEPVSLSADHNCSFEVTSYV